MRPPINVVVLGGSYAGGRAAELLAKTLPDYARVVLIDRQSHFNHLYLFPRVGVVPGHANKHEADPDFAIKVFIPFTGVLASPAQPPPATIPPPSLADPTPTPSKAFKSALVQASVTKIGDGWLEVDKDLGDDVLDARERQNESVEHQRAVEKLGHELEKLGVTEQGSNRRRVRFDYLVYALGCTLPPPLVTPALTKIEGMSFLQQQTQSIAQASSILIAGGGALGIQYATDIADLYNNPDRAYLRPKDAKPGPKKVTLVHSRQKFLPLYQNEVHDEVIRRLQELGVDVVLGERLQLPSVEEDKERNGEMRSVTLSNGSVIEYDLLLRCTGQKPNSKLMSEFVPQALDEWGYVNVKDTLQIDAPGARAESLSRVYCIGDVANAGVIKAGHTGWNQAGVAVNNIMAQIMCDSTDKPEMLKYEKTPPQIKVTLGLNHSVSELLPSMEAKETVVTTADNGPIDGYWQVVWSRMGVSTDDLDQ
ncbi:hypothetical protein OIV83_002287 [Microbotryomycetes sp. JL201]|nr:hypothetical protein OIV83_002287 [Microbotryomycetes sp. JL201]